MSKHDRAQLTDSWDMDNYLRRNCADAVVKRRLTRALTLIVLGSAAIVLAPMALKLIVDGYSVPPFCPKPTRWKASLLANASRPSTDLKAWEPNFEPVCFNGLVDSAKGRPASFIAAGDDRR